MDTGDSMAIKSERIKTSLFLTLLMILTPLAGASTVTTFSDGSSEVVIEFKDGIKNGQYIPLISVFLVVVANSFR